MIKETQVLRHYAPSASRIKFQIFRPIKMILLLLTTPQINIKKRKHRKMNILAALLVLASINETHANTVRVPSTYRSGGRDVNEIFSENFMEIFSRQKRGRSCAVVVLGKCIPPCARYHGKARRGCNQKEKHAHIIYYLRH